MRFALSLALFRAGKSKAAKMAMIAMTTSSSIQRKGRKSEMLKSSARRRGSHEKSKLHSRGANVQHWSSVSNFGSTSFAR